MTTKPKAENSAGPAKRGLQITARRDSFWRAGIQFFGDKAKTIPLTDLTAEQIEEIRMEGNPGGQLLVIEVEIPPTKG